MKQDNKVNKGWRTSAIVFIVLFVLQSMFVVWIFKAGNDLIDAENKCSVNVCDGYESYYFDNLERMCYCLNDQDIEYQKYIGG